MTNNQESLFQDLSSVCDFKAISGIPFWLHAENKSKLEDFLLEKSQILRDGRYQFLVDEKRDVDFSSAMPIATAKSSIERGFGNLLGSAGNLPTVLRLFNWLGERDLKAKLSK
jgi:hypothetical protein